MEKTLISDQRILQALMRNDFPTFLQKVFVTLNPGKSLKISWYLEAMAYYVGVVSFNKQPGMDRLLLNLPPRALKSTMISVALPAYLSGLDPRKRIVVVTYSQELSNMFGRQTRQVMQSDWYKQLFPSTRLSPKRQAEHDFHTTSGGYRLAASTGGVLTGRGGDLIIVDDPLKADDAWSDTRRKNSVEWTKSTLFSRLDDKQHGTIIVTQQRLHEEDLSGYLERTGDWLTFRVPAIAEQDELIAVGQGRPLHFRREGEVIDPKREPLELLNRIKRELGSAVFSAQYQQSPTPADGDVIKLSWFKRFDNAPSGGEVIMSVDTASKVGEHNDYSAFTVWRFVDGRYYLEFIWRGKVVYPELKRNLIAFAEVFHPDRIVIEDKVVGIGLIQDLHKEARHLPVVPYVPKVDKETRMRRHSARIESGQVYLPHEAEWLGDFELEVRQFPHGLHDDMVDSMSQMLDHHTAHNTGDLIIGSYRS